MDFSEVITNFIAGRLILSARDIQECFRLARGISISRTTLDEWEANGLWVRYIDGRKWYRWELTWRFYLEGAGRKPSGRRQAPAMSTARAPLRPRE